MMTSLLKATSHDTASFDSLRSAVLPSNFVSNVLGMSSDVSNVQGFLQTQINADARTDVGLGSHHVSLM